MARPDATEKATPKRKREARQRGQVPRSHDIGGSAIFLAIVISLHIGFLAAIDAGAQAFTVALTHAGSHEDLTIRSIGGLFLRSIMPYSPLLAMAFASGVVLAVVANVLQFGLLFSPQLIVPKFSKLNPASGATVVVTNPTHYAVALMWDDLKMDAPVLVAKGADLIAKHIRELAKEHDVPILENPPLARTRYAKVELDSPVPPDLYAAVAQVIAFVYKLKNKTIA